MKPFPLKDPIAHITWKGDRLLMLDQRLLPRRIHYLTCRNAGAVARAIRCMALRGAPLIGVAAAYGMALAARCGRRELARAGRILRRARPTAVNLMHGVDAMLAAAALASEQDLVRRVTRAAEAFHREDIAGNQRMAVLGASLLRRGSRVMTHCNAGALATGGLGTAVGVIRYAHHVGKVSEVFSCETRPYLQGSRLTMWELMQGGVPATLITDNMAAHVMKTCGIDAVIVGADRIAANADVCNKIGTYGLAILARHHGIPFFVVAPATTVDMTTPDGSRIPIEERSSDEVLRIFGHPIAPVGARARHFAFDVTPHDLVTAIVTDRGIVRPAQGRNLKKVVG